MIINYINSFLNITALAIGLKPISMTSHPLNRDQSCIERSSIRLKRELGRANCKRSVDKNHYFITDCMDIELVSLVIFYG